MIDPQLFAAQEQFSSTAAPAGTVDTCQLADQAAGGRSSRLRGRSASETANDAERESLPSDNHRETPSAQQTGIRRSFAERQALETSLQASSEHWRDEVAKRVEGYRTRRSKRSLAGDFSMRFDFEAPAPEPEESDLQGSISPGLQPESIWEPPHRPPFLDTAYHAEPEQEAEVPRMPSHMPSTEYTRVTADPRRRERLPDTKIIEFPRALVFPEFESDPYALAEPVFDKPRILDVPESIGAMQPPLADLALEHDPAAEEEPALQPTFELPLRVAPPMRRVVAGLMDIIIVAAACAVFALIVAHSLEGFPRTKPVLVLALSVPILFWTVYNYIFLVHAGATPGMNLMYVRLSTFEGTSVPRSLRRWRALLMVLSCASLGFGFLWAAFDQDGLSWHDKMTHTYLTLEP